MARVFISHSHRDKLAAKRVAAYLKENSADVWIDDESILVGDSIPDKIGEGIQSSDFVLVLLSSQSVKSGWVKREIEAKLGEEISTGKVKVLGVLCEKPDGTWSIPPLLAVKKYADITRDFTSGMKEVLRAIRGHAVPRSQQTSETKYLAYLLGFTVSKIAWYHGNPVQLVSLKTQYKLFVHKLDLDDELASTILETFRPTSNLGDVLDNARHGIEGRNALGTAILLQLGDTDAAAFRFGFNLVNLMPQLEFLQVAQENPSPKTSPEELLGSVVNQFDALLRDGGILGLTKSQMTALREAQSGATKGNAGAARDRLIEIGSEIERILKATSSEVH